MGCCFTINRCGVVRRGVVVLVAVVIVVAAVGVGAWFAFRPVSGPPESIKIGLPISLSGAIGAEGLRIQAILTALADKINSEGGIYVKEYDRKIPLELIILDCESDVSRTVELATKLCTEYNVIAMVQNHPPPYFLPVCNVAEAYNVPFVGDPPLEVFIGEGEKRETYWKWSWADFFSMKDAETPYNDIFKKFKDKSNGVAGILVPDDADGHYWPQVITPILEGLGYTVVFPGMFPSDTQDFTSIITEFKNKKVEVLYVNSFPYQFAPFARQCATLGFKPKIVIGGRWSTMASDVEMIGGGIGQGFMVETWWTWDYPYPYNDWIKETWQKVTDLDVSMAVGYVCTHLLVVTTAIEKAGTLDRVAVNNAIPQIELEAPVGPIKFDPKTHTAKGLLTIGQWVKTSEGKWVINFVWAPSGSGIQTVEAVPVVWP